MTNPNFNFRSDNTSLFSPGTIDADSVKNPATAALEKWSILPSRERKRARGCLRSRPRNSDSNCYTSLDMRDLVEVSKSVGESLSFPLIEWAMDDDTPNERDIDSGSIVKKDKGALQVPNKNVLRHLGVQSSSLPSLGKRSRSDLSNRLVRSIALDSQLFLLESSFCHMRSCTSTPSISRDSSRMNFTSKSPMESFPSNSAFDSKSTGSNDNLLYITRNEDGCLPQPEQSFHGLPLAA